VSLTSTVYHSSSASLASGLCPRATDAIGNTTLGQRSGAAGTADALSFLEGGLCGGDRYTNDDGYR
jgi:hypothetical protein